MGSYWSGLITDVELLTMGPSSIDSALLSAIPNSAIAINAEGTIDWIGPAESAKSDKRLGDSTTIWQGAGRLLTPGLIDCHTHLVYAGNRSSEWERRLTGVSYEQIAREGGGIHSTVQATRAADMELLIDLAVGRAEKLLAAGVTTIEIKSGYGLDQASETKMILAAAEVGHRLPVDVSLTLLAAHTIPKEFADDRAAYLSQVVEPLIISCASGQLSAAGVKAVDIFCEKIAFTRQESETVFELARQHGLAIKIHAEQLSNSGGAQLAAEFQAWSADHLEYLDEAGVAAMASSQTVAVLLPGAFYFINEKQRPPIDLLRKHQVPIALATDHNPGSSPVYSMPLVMNMGATCFGLSPAEAMAATTIHAARALRVDQQVGSIEFGKQADFALWDTQIPTDLVYRIGDNLCTAVWKKGQLVLGHL